MAKVLGIPKAIILQQILYWQLNTSDQGRWAKDKFGVQRKWIYNTSKDWEEQLPLDWTTIRDNLHDLAEETLRVDTWQGQEQAEVPFLYVEQWSKSKGIMTN
ncbi:MAG TPA: hypothetical protein VGT05_05220 [Patescibacteria group bacterium]|nr:hypothetical protein [Patescibacteria group bacterium]